MKGRGAEIDIIFKLIALISGHKEIFSGAGDVVSWSSICSKPG